jgi:hypothetical protein
MTRAFSLLLLALLWLAPGCSTPPPPPPPPGLDPPLAPGAPPGSAPPTPGGPVDPPRPAPRPHVAPSPTTRANPNEAPGSFGRPINPLPEGGGVLPDQGGQLPEGGPADATAPMESDTISKRTALLNALAQTVIVVGAALLALVAPLRRRRAP